MRHKTVMPVFFVFTQHVARNCGQYNQKNVIQNACIEMEEIKLSFVDNIVVFVENLTES